MAAEMAEQPAVLELLVERRASIAAEVRAVVPRRLCGITLVARGSSDNAALYGRYILEMAARRPAGLSAPSIHTLYRSPVEMDGYLAVAISQSGRTPEVGTVLRRLREQGARTVAIVNGAGSPLAAEAEVTVHLDAGTEVAVPATKTFTATLLALALIAPSLGEVAWSDPEIAALPGQVARLLADPAPAERLAARIEEGHRVLVTGRGLLLVAALETALKIRETAGIPAEGISPADLRHGPIAAIGSDSHVLSFRAEGAPDPDAPELIESLERRGARLQVIGSGADADCALPAGVPAGLLPLLAVVRGQQVAAALARQRGLDADAPAGLSKITLTH